MSDPKYPVYHGVIRFDDANVRAVPPAGGNIITLTDQNTGLGTKLKRGWFEDGPGAGGSASSPAIIPGSGFERILIKEDLPANCIRVNSSSAANWDIWLHDGASTAFSIASGGSDAGVTVHIVNNSTKTAASFGFVNATTVHEADWPTSDEFFL